MACDDLQEEFRDFLEKQKIKPLTNPQSGIKIGDIFIRTKDLKKAADPKKTADYWGNLFPSEDFCKVECSPWNKVVIPSLTKSISSQAVMTFLMKNETNESDAEKALGIDGSNSKSSELEISLTDVRKKVLGLRKMNESLDDKDFINDIQAYEENYRIFLVFAVFKASKIEATLSSKGNINVTFKWFDVRRISEKEEKYLVEENGRPIIIGTHFTQIGRVGGKYRPVETKKKEGGVPVLQNFDYSANDIRYATPVIGDYSDGFSFVSSDKIE